jgi:hypothetical protein
VRDSFGHSDTSPESGCKCNNFLRLLKGNLSYSRLLTQLD